MTEPTIERHPAREPRALTTIGDVLRHRAMVAPDAIAYTFLVDGENETQHVSYRELERRARRFARTLTGGNPVLLVFDPGLEFIAALYGCFLAGVVAVPTYPPDPRDLASGRRRLRRIA